MVWSLYLEAIDLVANTEQERQAILAAYPPVSDKKKSPWVDKVNKMSDAQVHAIYIRLKGQGKIK